MPHVLKATSQTLLSQRKELQGQSVRPSCGVEGGACCLPPSGPPKHPSRPVRVFVWPFPGGIHNWGPDPCHTPSGFLLGDTLSHTGVKSEGLTSERLRRAFRNVFLASLFSPLRLREFGPQTFQSFSRCHKPQLCSILKDRSD